MNYYTIVELPSHTLDKKGQTYTNTMPDRNQPKNQLKSTQKVAQNQSKNQDLNQDLNQTAQRNQTPTYRSATPQFLETIASSEQHQKPPQPPTAETNSSHRTREIQRTVALLLLYRNNHPHTQWPQTPPQEQPSSPHQPPLQLTSDQEVEGLTALWEAVLHCPPNNKSVMHWPWLLDDLVEEEVEAILWLEEAEAMDLLVAEEEAEAQRPRMPHRSLLHLLPTSEPWEQAHASSKETEDRQETS
jgi:hypothetical protein